MMKVTPFGVFSKRHSAVSARQRSFMLPEPLRKFFAPGHLPLYLPVFVSLIPLSTPSALLFNVF
jgi:hypothetical protein